MRSITTFNPAFSRRGANNPWRRRVVGALAGLALLAAACSSDADADPVTYFERFATLQADLETSVEALFTSPAATDLEAVLDGDPPTNLDSEQDAIVKQFMVEFWTGGLDAIAAHRADVADLRAPDSVQADHDAYVGALDAMLAGRIEHLDRIETTSGLELLDAFWEPTSEMDAVNKACSTLVDEAATHDVHVGQAICTEG